MNRLLSIALSSSLVLSLSASATDSAVGYAHLQSGRYLDAYREYRGLAERGYPAYQNIVAGMHAAGKGVPRDSILAHVWYSLSAAQGDREGIVGKKRLARALTATQLTLSRKLSQEYATEYLSPYRNIEDWQLD